MTTFVPNQDLTLEVVRIGRSKEPVLIIDDFLADPGALVGAAAHSKGWHDMPPGGYPGQRAPLPADYVRAVLRRLDRPIRRTLLKSPAKLDHFDCSFSMVTQAPADLSALQRVPHIDIARDNRVAILHYLCGPHFGGTAFFRQEDTELEQIGPPQRGRYLEARKSGLARLATSDQYPNEHTPGYARTGFTQARFNRIVAYRSFTLHSGIVEESGLLTDDPTTGRLTANFFVDYANAQDEQTHFPIENPAK
ncbi:MAG: DUF6445 family protein [Aliishimia sp.]